MYFGTEIAIALALSLSLVSAMITGYLRHQHRRKTILRRLKA